MASERKPSYKVVYEFQDITEDVSSDVIEITYEDITDGSSNEITVKLDDFDKKWKNEWLVNTGARIGLQIGYEGEDMLDCGDFGIDEIHYDGFPDTVELKCLSIGEDNELRQERTIVYEDQTIRQIIEKVADRNNMTVAATPLYAGDQLTLQFEQRVLNMVIGRAVQDRETDIGFLQRITSSYGMSFVFGKDQEDDAGNVLKYLHVFTRITLETIDPVSTISYPNEPNTLELTGQDSQDDSIGIQIKSYELKNKAQNSVKEVEVVYHDPFTQELYEYKVDYDALPPAGKINPLQKELNSFLRKKTSWTKVENKQQAEIAAAAMLYDIISSQVEGTMNTEGSNLLIAGSSVAVEGLGRLSGTYAISSSFHRINRRGGYTTRITVKMIA